SLNINDVSYYSFLLLKFQTPLSIQNILIAIGFQRFQELKSSLLSADFFDVLRIAGCSTVTYSIVVCRIFVNYDPN
ncbi:MAG TPA: hypothetical protein DEG09_04845, partial [Marinilabiliaceae bacterium]|nr:hypothetical protein [Marinilabiliaceae bacterium]